MAQPCFEHNKDFHYNVLHKLCRVCGENAYKPKRKQPNQECVKFKEELRRYFALDISNDTEEQFPTRMCHRCYMLIVKFRTSVISSTMLDTAKQRALNASPLWCLYDGSKTPSDCSLCSHAAKVLVLRRPPKRKRQTAQATSDVTSPSDASTSSSCHDSLQAFITNDPTSSTAFDQSTASSEMETCSFDPPTAQPHHSFSCVQERSRPHFFEDYLSVPAFPPSHQPHCSPHPVPQSSYSFVEDICSAPLPPSFPVPLPPSLPAPLPPSLPVPLLPSLPAPLPPSFPDSRNLASDVSFCLPESDFNLSSMPAFIPQHTSTPKRHHPSSPNKSSSPKLRRRLKMQSIATSPIKQFLPSILSLCKESNPDVVTQDQVKACAFLAKRITAKSEDKETLTLPTRGQPVAYKRIINPRKVSGSTGPDTLRSRAKKLKEIREFISGGTEESSNIQQIAEVKSLKKDVKDLLAEKSGLSKKVIVNKRYGVAMQTNAGFTYTQMRKMRRFFRCLGVVFENESAQRKELAKIIPHQIEVLYKNFYFINDEGDEIRKSAPMVRVKNLHEFVSEVLDSYQRNGLLTWHNGGIPENEVWLKIGGDHGRDSFKICMQIANLSKPNSKNNTLLIGLAKVKDSPQNLSLIFNEFRQSLTALSQFKWQGKQLSIFLFGDYCFLASTYGLSGANGKHPCLWCLKTQEEMQILTQKPADARTLQQIKNNYKCFMEKSKGKKQYASKHNNVVREPLVDIPISHVAPPSLHILLGVIKKHHTILEDGCDDIDKLLGDELIKKSTYKTMPGSYGKYLKTMKQRVSKLKVIQQKSKKINVQDIELQAQIKEASEKINREIQKLKKEKYPKRKGPVCSSLDEILKKHNIILQAYHGRSLVGNHCKKYLQRKVYTDLSRNVVRVTQQYTQNEKILMKATTTVQIFTHLNDLYSIAEKAVSHSRLIPASEHKTIENSIKSYLRFYRKVVKSKVYPKLHFLEDHCLEWIKNYRFGLGLHSEHGGEQLHKSIKILEIQSHGIVSEEKRLMTVMQKHLAQVSPDLLILVPNVKVRKRKAQ